MKKVIKIIFGLLIVLSPTLQLSAMESEHERFKQELLQEIKTEIKDMSDMEIRNIINEVDKQITEYIEHYEKTPKEQLLTKDELYLQQHRQEVSIQNFSMLQTQSDKSEEQRILEELNPKLKMLSKNDYHYDEEKGEIEFDVSKDKVFYAQENSMVQASLWQLLSVGDVLINFDNGTLGQRFGHAALLWLKGRTVRDSKTIEAPGYGDHVRIMSYDRWHNNYKNRITYNYIPSVHKTNKPALAAMNATRYVGTWYGLAHPLGMGPTMYCTELVFMAYLSQGISLGNSMKLGSPGILFPGSVYCDPKLMYYYRQNVGGGMC